MKLLQKVYLILILSAAPDSPHLSADPSSLVLLPIAFVPRPSASRSAHGDCSRMSPTRRGSSPCIPGDAARDRAILAQPAARRSTSAEFAARSPSHAPAPGRASARSACPACLATNLWMEPSSLPLDVRQQNPPSLVECQGRRAFPSFATAARFRDNSIGSGRGVVTLPE